MSRKQQRIAEGYYSISEVAALVSLHVETLGVWRRQGLVPNPKWTWNGSRYRYYKQADLERITRFRSKRTVYKVPRDRKKDRHDAGLLTQRDVARIVGITRDKLVELIATGKVARPSRRFRGSLRRYYSAADFAAVRTALERLA